MDVKVEVSALQASACAVVVKTTVEILSGIIFSPVVSDLTFTPIITINGGSISSIPANNNSIGVRAAA
jgi:hypothetical protein